ncbi:MAG: helix-turn-helix transcriptional regulator [Bacillota bacterium]|nr:helix-turn-helix transcriptional regulator [Bacillota bacterium]
MGGLYPALTGLAIAGWLLSFPFYGPLAFKLLHASATLNAHAFALGHALGFLFSNTIVSRQPLSGREPLAAAGLSACLAGACVFIPGLARAHFIYALAGFAAAIPMLAWAGLLTRTPTPIPPFAIAVTGANLWCLLAGLTPDGGPWPHLALLAGSAGYVAASCRLSLTPPDSAATHQPFWREARPLLVFAGATYLTGGLMYSALAQTSASHFWHHAGLASYILAFSGAALLGQRGFARHLPALACASLGLAALMLTAPTLRETSASLSLSYNLAMVGLACTDFYYWLALLSFARRGHERAWGYGLGSNVLFVSGAAILWDNTNLTAMARLPLAGVINAAVLFALVPLVLPRLARLLEPEVSPPTPGSESAPPAPRLRLTRSEKQVLDLLLDGHTYQEIAAHLYVSVNTVKYHIKNIYRKAGCRSRSELIARLGPTRGKW